MFNYNKFNSNRFNSGASPSTIDVPLLSVYLHVFCPTLPMPTQIIVGDIVDIAVTTFIPSICFAISTTTCDISLVCFVPRVGDTVKHVAIRAIYTETPMRINRVYVVGTDMDGNFVYGEAQNQTEIDLYGEQLRFHIDTSITTTEWAIMIAESMLKQVRLERPRGSLLIPPNVGMELWDVIDVTDTVCSKTNAKYRVKGWGLEYDNSQSKLEHTVSLTEV
jgi:hypothetical protein